MSLAKFDIFCDEDVPQPPTNNQMNPPPMAKKLHALQAQPNHQNHKPLAERGPYNRRNNNTNNNNKINITETNLKKHDAQLTIHQEHQQQLASRNSNILINKQHNRNVQSLRNSLSTCSDVSEYGIKTMSVEEAAEKLQSRLADWTHKNSPPSSPMSVDDTAGVSIARRRTSTEITNIFKHDDDQDDVSFSDQENNYDTEIEEDDENRYYADEDGFDDSDISISEDVLDCSMNFDVATIFKCQDYLSDIQEYLVSLERSPAFRPNPNYMQYQEEIDSTMRSVLVDWMVDVAEEQGLQHETLFQAVSMVDRFLSTMGISTSSFQLLGVAALFTASKYEEIYPPDLYQFVNVTDKTYSAAQILNMEQLVLKAVDFRISGPTPYYFLCKILTYETYPVQVYHLAEYFCYLTMMEDQPFLEYYPSEIAISAVILAIYELGLKDSISDTMIEAYHKANNDQLERRISIKESQCDRRTRSKVSQNKLPLCIEAIHAMQEYAPSHKQQAIYNRFSSMT